MQIQKKIIKEKYEKELHKLSLLRRDLDRNKRLNTAAIKIARVYKGHSVRTDETMHNESIIVRKNSSDNIAKSRKKQRVRQ